MKAITIKTSAVKTSAKTILLRGVNIVGVIAILLGMGAVAANADVCRDQPRVGININLGRVGVGIGPVVIVDHDRDRDRDRGYDRDRDRHDIGRRDHDRR